MSARDQALRKAFLASFLGIDGSFLITTGMLRDFEAALSAAGWVVVPREPTPAMCFAGINALQASGWQRSEDDEAVGCGCHAYRAMIAAALSAAPQETK